MNQPPVIEPKPAKGRLLAFVIWVVVLCGLSAAADLPFARAQNLVTQLLAMLGFGGYLLALVLSLFFAWTGRKQLQLLAVIPLLLCLGSCVATTVASRAARQAQFEGQFPRYVALIDRIQAEGSVGTGKIETVPLLEGERDLGYSLLVERNTNGMLTVELLTGRGFPLMHSGYLYTSSGEIQSGSVFDSRWPYKVKVRPKWFRISD